MTWAERPDLTRAIYEVACEAYPDVPGEEGDRDGLVRGPGSRRTCSGDSDRPEATFIALADGEVAGYAKLSLSSSRTEGRHPRHDRRAARVPRARDRGGAEAGRDRLGEAGGLRGLETSNEVRNEPIRRLNERHGYTVQPGVVVLHDSLAGHRLSTGRAHLRLPAA